MKPRAWPRCPGGDKVDGDGEEEDTEEDDSVDDDGNNNKDDEIHNAGYRDIHNGGRVSFPGDVHQGCTGRGRDGPRRALGGLLARSGVLWWRKRC